MANLNVATVDTTWEIWSSCFNMERDFLDHFQHDIEL